MHYCIFELIILPRSIYFYRWCFYSFCPKTPQISSNENAAHLMRLVFSVNLHFIWLDSELFIFESRCSTRWKLGIAHIEDKQRLRQIPASSVWSRRAGQTRYVRSWSRIINLSKQRRNKLSLGEAVKHLQYKNAIHACSLFFSHVLFSASCRERNKRCFFCCPWQHRSST